MTNRCVSGVMDLFFVSVVLCLGFLSVSHSLGFSEYSGYFEHLLGSDKALHFIAGSSIALTVFRALRFTSIVDFYYRLFCSVGFTLVVLFADEFSQLAIIYREFSLDDLFAGLLGLLFAVAIIMLMNVTIFQREIRITIT